MAPGAPRAFALAVTLALSLAVAGAGAGATGNPQVKPKAPSTASKRSIDPADLALYEKLSASVSAAWDSARGGWVGHTGAPCESAIELALVRGREGDALAGPRAVATMRWMRALMDTVGGGYVTAFRDIDPHTAQMEKLTDSNARRLELLALAMAGGSGEPMLAHDARASTDYFERVLTDPRGGFLTGQIGSRDLEPEANGLAAVGWLRYGALIEDPRRREFSWKSLDRIWNECRDPDLGMVRRDIWGKIHDPSLLSDQAEAGRAFLIAWQVAGRDTDLARARILGHMLLRNFEDPGKWGFREEYAYERYGHAHRSARPFDDNARAARFLAELGAATGETEFTASARRAFSTFAQLMEKPRLETAEWALALRATWAGTGAVRCSWSGGPRPKTTTAAVRKPSPARKKRSARAGR